MAQSSPPDAGESDAAWLVRFANGDPEAARVLTTRLAPRAFGFALRLLGDRAEAEDVAQDALLRLWRHAPQWRQDGPATPSTWLLRVVRNLCVDRMRRSGRHITAGSDEIVDTLPDPAPSVAARMIHNDRVAALDRALASLPARQREAVVLRHLEELGNPEIAVIMDISVEAVESLLARGRRAIAAQLAGQRRELGYEDETG